MAPTEIFANINAKFIMIITLDSGIKKIFKNYIRFWFELKIRFTTPSE